jgi:hypothetical protein
MSEITALCLEQKCVTANSIADLADIMAMGSSVCITAKFSSNSSFNSGVIEDLELELELTINFSFKS